MTLFSSYMEIEFFIFLRTSTSEKGLLPKNTGLTQSGTLFLSLIKGNGSDAIFHDTNRTTNRREGSYSLLFSGSYLFDL